MQIDWTTFLLEILNFLILVWLLKRLLYRPVLDALAARSAAMKRQAQEAGRLKSEAESLEEQYRTRLDEWEREREEKRRALADELTGERADGFRKLQQSLAEEHDRAVARERAKSASHEAELLRQAQTEAYAETGAMLSRLADAALTSRIVGMAVEDLAALPEEKCDVLRHAAERMGKGDAMDITSAHELDADDLLKIRKGVERIAGRELPYNVKVSSDLIAGLRVGVGEYVLHANLADELAFFHREGGA